MLVTESCSGCRARKKNNVCVCVGALAQEDKSVWERTHVPFHPVPPTHHLPSRPPRCQWRRVTHPPLTSRPTEVQDERSRRRPETKGDQSRCESNPWGRGVKRKRGSVRGREKVSYQLPSGGCHMGCHMARAALHGDTRVACGGQEQACGGLRAGGWWPACGALRCVSGCECAGVSVCA